MFFSKVPLRLFFTIFDHVSFIVHCAQSCPTVNSFSQHILAPAAHSFERPMPVSRTTTHLSFGSSILSIFCLTPLRPTLHVRHPDLPMCWVRNRRTPCEEFCFALKIVLLVLIQTLIILVCAAVGISITLQVAFNFPITVILIVGSRVTVGGSMGSGKLWWAQTAAHGWEMS